MRAAWYAREIIDAEGIPGKEIGGSREIPLPKIEIESSFGFPMLAEARMGHGYSQDTRAP